MQTVPGPNHPIHIDALHIYRHHSLKLSYHGVGKMLFRKADHLTMTSIDAVHEYFLSIAISLCNKIVCVYMVGFCISGHICMVQVIHNKEHQVGLLLLWTCWDACFAYTVQGQHLYLSIVLHYIC